MKGNEFKNMGNSHIEVNTESSKEAVATFASYLPDRISSSVRWAVGISTLFIVSASITASIFMYNELVKHNEMIQDTHRLVENVNKRHYELRDMIETINLSNQEIYNYLYDVDTK